MSTFSQLHHAETPLVLPNAWDPGSALAFSHAGFPALGTTSFGVAASAGMPDGARSSKAATVALVARIVSLPLHVSVDIEDGYSDDPAEVADFVAELAALGVAGINIEDSTDGHLVDPAAAAAKIAAVKLACPDVFVNARADNYWCKEDLSREAVLARALIYAEAGADGVFVPGLSAAEDIAAIAAGIQLPLNVLAHPSLTVAELGGLGVRRISSGSLPYRAALDAAVAAVIALRDGALPPAATSYWDLQNRLEEFARK